MNTHIVTEKSYESEGKMPKENALWFKYRFDRNYIDLGENPRLINSIKLASDRMFALCRRVQNRFMLVTSKLTFVKAFSFAIY